MSAAGADHSGTWGSRLISCCDSARREMWRLSARTSLGRRCISDKGTRLAVLASGHVLVAFVLSGVAPVWLLLVGPLLLGVPHVVNDVRYLLMRSKPRLSERALLAIGLPLTAMTGLRVAALFGAPMSLTLELWLGTAAVIGGVLTSRAPAWVKAALSGVAASLGLLASGNPAASVTVFAHLHNLIGLALWLWMARKSASRPQLLAVIALFAAASVAISLGVFDGLIRGAYLAGPVGGLSTAELTETLAPGLTGEQALRLVTLFAFAQAVHYSVWLRLIPQEMDPRAAPPSFTRSWRRLVRDLRRSGTAAVVVATGVVALGGLLAPSGTRHAYLMVVVFHGWLELAVIGALCARAMAERRAVNGGR